MKKGTKLYSILNNKCPSCHEGEFFDSKNAYNLSKMASMPEHCSECNLKYEPEIGFYFGSMYVSYGFGVAIFVTIWVALGVLAPDMGPWGIIGFITAGLILFFPVSFRLSRRIWINLFVKYEEIESKNLQHK